MDTNIKKYRNLTAKVWLPKTSKWVHILNGNPVILTEFLEDPQYSTNIIDDVVWSNAIYELETILSNISVEDDYFRCV